jgi:hypothetical protein
MSTDSSTEAKSEAPKGLLEKIGAALPVGLTALATVLAGLSTGALQQAMYWKSQAAQDQSRAADQWSFAGFKRDRALIMQTSAAQLRATAGYVSPNFPPLTSLPDEKKTKETEEALNWLQKRTVPASPLPEITDERIKAVLKAIEAREPEAELLKLAVKIDHESMNKALNDAERKSKEYDDAWTPILKAAANIAGSALNGDKLDPATRTARQAVGYDLEEQRYRTESKLNQSIALLYEVRVKISGAESDKHRRKSQLFFYAMLVAQIGATASALALARKLKSVLWVFASMIGLVSIGIGAYVYLEQ